MTAHSNRRNQVIDALPGKTILVLGDVMLDESISGDVRRISPEAPVPIVEYRERKLLAGGAANVAANVVSLGCRALLAGVVGEDEGAISLHSAIESNGISTEGLLVDNERPTTVKLRILGHNQQIVRLDREVRTPIRPALQAELLRWLTTHLDSADACILSDYGKGVLAPSVARDAIAACLAAGVPVLVDPKGLDCRACARATYVKPNKQEAERLANREIATEADFIELGQQLAAALDGSGVLITRGSMGMSLFRNGRAPFHVTTPARNVYDVTGAGDTVISVMAATLAAGATPEDAVWFASNAAAIVVEKLGTATVTASELRDRLC